jgi:hypothetical protein
MLGCSTCLRYGIYVSISCYLHSVIAGKAARPQQGLIGGSIYIESLVLGYKTSLLY